MEIIDIKNEYTNETGDFNAFNAGKFSEEEIMYVLKEALEKGRKYSLEDIKIVEKVFFAYRKKIRLEDAELLARKNEVL